MFTSSLLPATLTYLSEEPIGGVLMRAKMGSKVVKAILVSWEKGLGHVAVKDHGSGSNARHCTVVVDKGEVNLAWGLFEMV